MQTSVEWLFEEIKHIIPNTFLNKFEQAKEMEKQQIVDAYYISNDMEGRGTLIDAEQYYKETFKSK
jgi:hypothetical protein